MKILRIVADGLYVLLVCAVMLLCVVGFISEIVGPGVFERWLIQQGFSWGIPGVWWIGGGVLLSFAIIVQVRKMIQRD